MFLMISEICVIRVKKNFSDLKGSLCEILCPKRISINSVIYRNNFKQEFQLINIFLKKWELELKQIHKKYYAISNLKRFSEKN